MARRKISLITGIAGFVGRYLTQELESKGDWDLVGIQRSGERSAIEDWKGRIPIHELDIRDAVSTGKLIQKVKPDVVFHLAAQAFVPKAVQDPWGTLDINVKGTLNILEALRGLNKPVRMVYISSADVYGKQDPANIPLHEEIMPNPVNPYSSSKLAAEVYCRQFSMYAENLDVMIARPFNHIGVGQRLEFVVPNFCSQIVQQKKKGGNKISVGDLTAIRDFLDVRDVVSSYHYLAECGRSGQIYNICSGNGISIREILDKIIQNSNEDIFVEIDPSRLRPVETPKLVGDNRKIKELGWKPNWGIDESLKEIYSWISSL